MVQVEAGARLQSEQLEGEFRVGDFTTLPWFNSHFEAVLYNVSLYANPWGAARRAVQEVQRVLKSGGRFFSSCFSTRTWGFGTRDPGLREGEFYDVAEGPLSGKGFCRFLEKNQLAQLYLPLNIDNVERASFTLEDGSRVIELWLVSCRKRHVGMLGSDGVEHESAL